MGETDKISDRAAMTPNNRPTVFKVRGLFRRGETSGLLVQDFSDTAVTPSPKGGHTRTT